jgi:Domain of unknown function (DUF5606)
MSFEKIISIPGMPGLYKMVAQMRNGGFVVEGLNDSKRIPVSAMQRITLLKDISVYTVEGDILLVEVFKSMQANDAAASKLNAKSDPAELKAALKLVLPDFDQERVHVSDIKKMFVWYNLLKATTEFKIDEPVEGNADADTKELKAEVAPAAEAKPKKVVRKKKTDEGAPTAGHAAPPKKITRKTAP